MSNWWEHAACKGRTDLFFPRNNAIKQARQMCASCPVAEQCALEAAHLHQRGELHGIWAGQTRQQRDKQHGRHRKAWWRHE